VRLAAAWPLLDRSHGRDAVGQPRIIIAWLLLIAGVAWAAARGLHFYGFDPADAGYGLDQPPLLLMLVAGWIMIRSRRS
jgi:hypothetical protein